MRAHPYVAQLTSDLHPAAAVHVGHALAVSKRAARNGFQAPSSARTGNAEKLPCAGLRLNASKPESMLDRKVYLPGALFAATIASANATINNQNIAPDKSFADDLEFTGCCKE